ncbi:D-alanyl-D-alanine carboxypeptidase family protein [Acuticoccus sediminis]|uniref:D-alanyl-D-alanine carboxypeptidase family protein n=1 Tax=Acuticoccus sediminis TaxID=2184697 RepID=UPI001CFF25E9|nr:D-alanyl-D-alanine carboxypeptidase family protein [Acuticoccus sediminis]
MRGLIVLLCVAVLAGCQSAETGSSPELAAAPAAAAEPILPLQPVPAVAHRAYASIVVDGKTGKILEEDDATSPRYPASLTKMMTLYLVFEQLSSGRWTPQTALTVSAEAASRPPAKLGVRAGSTIPVDTAVRALAVRSANDVAVVIAENIAGSEDAFARRMTAKARALGMSRTSFVNASGLPDDRQYTTARDIAILGKALHDRFPQYFKYFSTREISYGGRTWKNTNKLLTKVDGVNGIKTGYIRDSGFNLCASVERDGKHIIAVVLGGKSGASRNAQMEKLIEEYLPQASGGSIFGF